MPIQNPFQNLNWDRQKTAITVISILALALVISLFTRGGSDDNAGTTVPPTTAADTTLVEDLEYIGEHFPGFQLNTASAPYVCTADNDILDAATETNEDLQAAAKDEMARDKKKLKDIKLQELTIVLSEEGDRFTGFVVRATGTLEEGDKTLALTDIVIGDGTWTPERSTDFAKSLREELKKNPLFSLRAGSGGHRVRLNFHVPHHRSVED